VVGDRWLGGNWRPGHGGAAQAPAALIRFVPSSRTRRLPGRVKECPSAGSYIRMAGTRPTEWRLGARRYGHLRTGSTRGPGPRSIRDIGDDRLLAPLRRHRGWTLLGLVVAAVAAATRFAAIGVLPPSIKIKPFAHADASTQVELTTTWSSAASNREPYDPLSTQTYALADMVDSPEITRYVARAAGLPASKIGVLGPLWTELWRSQQWASGPQRDRQITIEKDPYQITINQESTLPGDGPGPGPGPPIIDVLTQAPTPETATRLAAAVAVGLSAYIQHAQATGGVPERDRYYVRQLVPVSVAPARASQLANVGLFTFLAVFVLWCGAEIAVSSLLRDLRAAAAASKVGAGTDRSSESGPFSTGTRWSLET
jgi:hypothetical protein